MPFVTKQTDQHGGAEPDEGGLLQDNLPVDGRCDERTATQCKLTCSSRVPGLRSGDEIAQV